MPPRPRPAPFLGPLAAAVLLLYTGGAVFAERVGWVQADLGVFFAGALVIVGVVLIVSAFVGRARGLIALGLLILPLAWFFSAVDLVWWNGIGEERVVADELGELEEEYRWGIGDFQLDLSTLDLEGESRHLAVGLTIGELTVFVPDTIEVDIDVEGGIGEIVVDDGDDRSSDEGVNLDLDRTTGDAAGGNLALEVDIGIGKAEVIVCGGTRGAPCP